MATPTSKDPYNNQSKHLRKKAVQLFAVTIANLETEQIKTLFVSTVADWKAATKFCFPELEAAANCSTLEQAMEYAANSGLLFTCVAVPSYGD